MTMTTDTAQGPVAAGDAARLVALVRRAATVLPTSWPLETFIAVNPLAGLEELPFEEAGHRSAALYGAPATLPADEFRRLYDAGRIRRDDLLAAAADRVDLSLTTVVGHAADGRPVTVGDLVVADLFAPGADDGATVPAGATPLTLAGRCDQTLGTDLARTVDDEAARWTATVVGAGAGGWDPPGLERGAYEAWRPLAVHDRRLPRRARRLLAAAPDDARAALVDGLAWCADDADRVALLQAHLLALPGWAALLHGRGTGELLGYLAVRVVLERALVTAAVGPDRLADLVDGWSPGAADPPVDPATPVDGRLRAALDAVGAPADALDDDGRALAAAALDRLAPDDRPFVWLAAHERGYRAALLASIGTGTPGPVGTPRHAAVFCIDPRSEGLRRHLEHDGMVATYGFAGFFAVAMAYRDVAGGEASPQCPVLVEPRVDVVERPASPAVEAVARDLRGRRVVAGAHDGFHEAKDDLVGPYALADAGGWVAGPVALARTLAARPYGRLREAAHRALVPGAATELVPEPSITFEEQVLFARVLLSSTGLHDAGARLVLVCGHGSTTENNPYRSALDCGACGGHRGAPNARIAAAVLNRAEVREALVEHGITLDETTWFVAGEHDTATDEVLLLDRHLVPDSHADDLADLARRLEAAGDGLAVERAATLPGAPGSGGSGRTVRAVRGRSVDWAQVYPEWGLAGNAAFVVGPRSLTRGVDLGRRVFLHSYDAAADGAGDALETILTAPMVVAQWINCQYYFSSVAPDVFGAGTKTVHNVTAGAAGVVSGSGGDLRLGLPWQSVGIDGRPVHEPLRLLCVVEAPIDRIDAVIARNQVLRRLFDNGWVALVARAGPAGDWRERRRDGTWHPWDGPDSGAGHETDDRMTTEEDA